MSNCPLILAVDRNQRNLVLLAKFLSEEGYEMINVSSLEEFEPVIQQSITINMALVDISGFDRRIWDCCEQLRNAQIPFLVLSSKQSMAIHQESLAHGARSMLVKPLVVKELLGLIKSLLQVAE